MGKEIFYPDAGTWNWRDHSPFARSVAVGDQVFVSGQQSLGPDGTVLHQGNIAAQTREVFENMGRSLAQVGLGFADLVRLNTYYVFDGADADATRYWEDMTRVRLEYFPDPGPAATAVRVKGMPYSGQLIQIEGIALRGRSQRERQRIMPAGSWDWSIAVPLSQGWRVGERVFVGGQISADTKGASVHVGDLAAQTRNIYKFIGNVLHDAGGTFDDVVHIKICFKHDSREADGTSFIDRIMAVSREVVGKTAPVLTAFGVDLLYPGLDLEIDAMAIIDPNRQAISAASLEGRYQPADFSDVIEAAGEIYVGGQVAMDATGQPLAPGDQGKQARIVFQRLRELLGRRGATLADVVKLNLFLVGEGSDVADAFHEVSRAWHEIAPDSHPAVTPVRVHELARPGLLVQADCVALK